VLYRLSHTSSPFCSGYFGDGVLLSTQASLDLDPPILYFLQEIEVAGICHHTQLFFYQDGVLQTFWSGLASDHDPPK
jgi:hypothetical protein